MTQRSRYLDDSLKKIVDPVIQRFAFYAHPENLLLSMLVDDNKVQREIAYRKIKKNREAVNSSESTEARKFTVPQLNKTATTYSSQIYWHEVEMTEPPLTKDISDEELRNVVENNNIKNIVPELPCHTQCGGKVHTTCNKCIIDSYIGYEARDGFIRNRIGSRRLMPAFETKNDFV